MSDYEVQKDEVWQLVPLHVSDAERDVPFYAVNSCKEQERTAESTALRMTLSEGFVGGAAHL